MPDYGLKIAETFQKYLKTGDQKLIENYSSKELKVALSRLSPYYDHNKLWFRDIERRINELDSIAQKKQSSFSLESFLQKDRIIAFLFGLLIGVLF